jgi:PAS domain S-box-containing protein/putative nucleotidyltransferase with HDIG domain
LISALIGWVYLAYFYSQPGQPFEFANESLGRVIIWALVMPSVAIIVDYLNRQMRRLPARAERTTIPQDQVEEYVHARQALEESERRYGMLIEQASDGIFVADPQGRFLDANYRGCEMLGLTREELLRLTLADLIPAEDLVSKPIRFDELRAGKSLVSERRLRRKDSTLLQVEISAKMLPDGRLQGIVRDITERKRAEEELGRNREAALQFSEQLAVLQEVTNKLSKAESSDELCQHAVQFGRSRLEFDRVSIWFIDERLGIMQGSFGTDESGELRDERSARVPFRPEGLAWHVFSHKESTAHIEHHPLYNHLGQVVGDGDNAMAALWDGDEVIGVMSVDNLVHRRPITERQLEVLRLYATTLGHLITLKRAEEALRASEARFRTFVDHAADAFFLFDDQGTILDVNRQACENLGYAREELIGTTALDFDPYATPAILDKISARLESGEVVAFETRHCRKDGTIFPVEVRSRPFWQGGRRFGVALARDITERKQAEEQLAASEAELRALFAAMTDVVMVVDRKGRYLKIAPTNPKLLFRPAADLLGKGLREVFPTAQADFFLAHIQEALAKKQAVHFEYDLPIDEKETWFAATVSPMTAETVVCVARDITESKRAEENLYHRLAELEAISRISAALRTAQTLEEMLPILLDETLAALDSTAGVIWLYEPKNDALRMVIARGWFNQLGESPIKPGEGIAGMVFARGEAYLSPEFATDRRARSSVVESIPRGWGGICVPIRAAAEVVGVLFVSVQLPREITPEEVKLLTSLAEMAGTAMHRLRLHEETVRRLEILQALHTVDRTITASLDARTTLNVLLEQVSARLGVDAAGVLLYNPQLLILEYAAGRGFHSQNYERSRLHLGEGIAGRAALERRMIQIDHILDSPDFVRSELLRSEGFTAYAVVPFVAKGQLKGVLEVFHRTPLGPSAEWQAFLDAFAYQAAIAIDNIQLFQDLQRSNMDLILTYDATIEGWARALEMRDQETEGHTRRVTELSERLARTLNVDALELVHLRRGALLHDIGKMGIPDSILLKPGPLSTAEQEIMRRHPQYAFEMLAPIAYLRLALDIPYCHHEHWNGAGYPRGLVGEQIPLAARIFAVVDVWDALRSDRPYRGSWSEEKALEYLREQAGRQFDPKVVEQFIHMIETAR